MKQIILILFLVISKISLSQETNTFIISALNVSSVKFTIRQHSNLQDNSEISSNKISDFKYEYYLKENTCYSVLITDLSNNTNKSIYINTGKIIKNLGPLKFNADFNTTASLHVRYNKKLKIYEYAIYE
jgi:hypothetical protein